MTLIDQINRDIKFKCDGKIPKEDCYGRIIKKLEENGFSIYERGDFIFYIPEKTKKS
ncbi:MAG: hypothetical protein GTN36_03345 [Candidatus Aenigmarchaeota archaeon]|nr:hypothetical protein [Candidatus Aenigmarchaeota archaeon]